MRVIFSFDRAEYAEKDAIGGLPCSRLELVLLNIRNKYDKYRYKMKCYACIG